MSNNRKRVEPWRNNERHYCEICNVWMGSDRQSILLHENGKKHKEQVEESLQKKRRDKLEEDKNAKLLQASLAKMEQAALQSHAQHDGGTFYRAPPPPPPPRPRPAHVPSSAGRGKMTGLPPAQQYPYQPPPFVPPPLQPNNAFVDTSLPVLFDNNFSQPHQQQTTVKQEPQQQTSSFSQTNSSLPSSKEEKMAWESRKKQRQEEKQRKRDGDGDDDNDNDNNGTSNQTRKRMKLNLDEGHYSHDDKVYLEGSTFYEILEEDMPVQLWTGSLLANLAEKQLLERDMYWKDALIVAVRRRKKVSSAEDDTASSCVVHVAYLATSDATEETLEKNVPVDRIRIVLGADASIPDSLEEARLLAMGGEEIHVEPPSSSSKGGNGIGGDDVSQQPQPEIDEATGFSGWSTVTIKRTTVRQELKEERERLRQQRKVALLEKEAQKKEAEVRRMEEAKAGNADDSALGAYETLGKGGYKGVDIEQESNTVLTIEDTAQRLALGKGPVAFKKKSKKPAGAARRNNRRTTTADDDDD